MIHPGTSLKFRIAAVLGGFSLDAHPWAISITDRYGRVRWQLTKDDCFRDSSGKWYFAMERVPTGIYFAKFTAFTPDKDYNETYRRTVDRQPLVAVGCCDTLLRKACCCDMNDKHFVSYIITDAANLDAGTYLEGADGAMIFTADDRRIEIKPTVQRKVKLDTLTGEEFKQTVEGRSDDSKINTVPEVMDVMQGLDEDTELTTMTDADVDDMMSRILQE